MISTVSGGWLLPFLIAGTAAFLINLFFIATAKSHIELTTRPGDIGAVQASHKVATPRIGGLSIFLGMIIGSVLIPQADQPWFLKLVLAGTPVMIAGLLEDLGRPMSPRLRLMASAVSALLAMHLTGALITRVDLPVDVVLGFAPVAVIFTTFAVAGVCNAINLVDGMNGLAGTLSIFSAAGLALISLAHGEPTLAVAAGLVASVILGFMMLNFPRGLIFLGDAGAYLIGFVLAWISVELMHDRPDVSAWSILLVNFWPVADTVLAIYRRRTGGKATDMPDRLHFHQLVRRWLAISVLGRHKGSLSNPLTTLAIAPFALAPVTFGVFFADDVLHSALAVASFGALFVLSYYGLLAAARGRNQVRTVQPMRRATRKVVSGQKTAV